jgi:hypothetical protein
MVLAWHTNIAPRWLEPLRHDGGATPDNFLNVAQDALIKNFRDELYDHLTLAERYEFAEDAKSATPRRWQSQRSDEGAGYPNGFTVDWATPAPNYYSRGERVVSQLQNIGIRSKLPGHGAGRVPETAATRFERVARGPDHHERCPRRRKLGQLV